MIYVGKGRLWDGAKNLHSMLDIDDELRPFVNDYKLNLFDYHNYENFEIFQTEIRLLFEALSSGSDKKMMKKTRQKTR